MSNFSDFMSGAWNMVKKPLSAGLQVVGMGLLNSASESLSKPFGFMSDDDGQYYSGSGYMSDKKSGFQMSVRVSAATFKGRGEKLGEKPTKITDYKRTKLSSKTVVSKPLTVSAKSMPTPSGKQAPKLTRCQQLDLKEKEQAPVKPLPKPCEVDYYPDESGSMSDSKDPVFDFGEEEAEPEPDEDVPVVNDQTPLDSEFKDLSLFLNPMAYMAKFGHLLPDKRVFGMGQGPQVFAGNVVAPYTIIVSSRSLRNHYFKKAKGGLILNNGTLTYTATSFGGFTLNIDASLSVEAAAAMAAAAVHLVGSTCNGLYVSYVEGLPNDGRSSVAAFVNALFSFNPLAYFSGGSLLENGTFDVVGDATVKLSIRRYSKAFWDFEQPLFIASAGPTTDQKWWFKGSSPSSTTTPYHLSSPKDLAILHFMALKLKIPKKVPVNEAGQGSLGEIDEPKPLIDRIRMANSVHTADMTATDVLNLAAEGYIAETAGLNIARAMGAGGLNANSREAVMQALISTKGLSKAVAVKVRSVVSKKPVYDESDIGLVQGYLRPSAKTDKKDPGLQRILFQIGASSVPKSVGDDFVRIFSAPTYGDFFRNAQAIALEVPTEQMAAAVLERAKTYSLTGVMRENTGTFVLSVINNWNAHRKAATSQFSFNRNSSFTDKMRASRKTPSSAAPKVEIEEDDLEQPDVPKVPLSASGQGAKPKAEEKKRRAKPKPVNPNVAFNQTGN